jgi:protein-S-isoprenylcysteine O-methyltransferase Ste14
MAPLFAAAVLALSILPEERHLEARFGEDYLDYKERTRRWF